MECFQRNFWIISNIWIISIYLIGIFPSKTRKPVCMSPVKQRATTLIYDGGFNGSLTAAFEAFDQKIHVVDIQRNGQAQSGLFSVSQTGFTQVDKAKRVWNGIRNKNHNALANVYFAFLSGAKGVEPLLYAYIQRLMRAQK